MRLLVFRTDRLGEFLLTLPAIKILRDFYAKQGSLRLTIVLNESLSSIIPALSWVDDFIIYNGFWKVLPKVFNSYELSVVFNPNKELHLLSYFSGAKFRLGYDRKWSFLLTNVIQDKKYEATKHELLYNLDLIKIVTGFSYQESEINQLINGLFNIRDILPYLPKDLVIIHPFSSDIRKEVELQQWKDVLSVYIKEGQKLCLIGSLNEKMKAMKFISYFSNCDILNLVGELTLYELGALLKYHCKEFWGLDSGPAHFAALLNVKVNVFWSYAAWQRWKPWGQTTYRVNF